MPKTATGKVQRRHVATAMVANEKSALKEGESVSTVIPHPGGAITFGRFLSLGRSLISYFTALCQGACNFVLGAKKAKVVQ